MIKTMPLAAVATIVRLLTVAATLPMIASGPAAASEAYPARSLRLMVGFTAGGPADIPARFVADRLGTSLGKPVVVENKAGAGSLLAMHEMLAQPRDGHTLLLCTVLDPVNSVL